jgi:hypothetical protein
MECTECAGAIPCSLQPRSIVLLQSQLLNVDRAPSARLRHNRLSALRRNVWQRRQIRNRANGSHQPLPWPILGGMQFQVAHLLDTLKGILFRRLLPLLGRRDESPCSMPDEGRILTEAEKHRSRASCSAPLSPVSRHSDVRIVPPSFADCAGLCGSFAASGQTTPSLADSAGSMMKGR